MICDRAAVLQALRPVEDPELGVSIVELGLVRDVRIEEAPRAIHVTLAMTSPLCPLGDEIARQAERALADRFEGVEARVVVDLDAKWSPADMSEVARGALGW